MRLLAALVVAILFPLLAQAQTSASLRQPRIYAGDIAELTIVHDAGIPSLYSVDTTPLLADFEVLGTESRLFRVQQDNRSVHRMEWRARLLPRRSGRLAVPELEFGKHRSAALTLTVEPVPPAVDAEQRIFVEIETQPPDPYPGQQTRVVTRLFHNLPLDGGTLAEPKSFPAQLFRSGRERRYGQVRDGVSYDVLERSVLLLPLTAATLEVLPASISARLPAPVTGPFELAGATRYLHRSSDSVSLRLRDIPPGIEPRDWLPAEDLAISLEWLDRPGTLTPGDSLELVLDIRARGQAADVLPENLLLRDAEHFSVYADPPARRNRVAGEPGEEYLVGHLRQRYVILLERAGDTRLPGLSLDWWDTGQDRARTARLEAVPLAIAEVAVDPATGRGAYRFADSADATSGSALVIALPAWPSLAAAILVLVLVGIAARFWRERGDEVRTRLARYRLRRHWLRRLAQACDDNDATAARRALLTWSRLHFPGRRIYGLGQLVSISDAPGWRDALARLDAALYAANGGAWQGDDLWRLVRAIAGRGDSIAGDHAQSRLPGLYPEAGLTRRPATSPRPV